MTLFNEQFNELVRVTLPDRQQINDQTNSNKNLQVVHESAKSQDFFQKNNALGKRCTTTRIKSRNFLSNIVYPGINKEDYCNEFFFRCLLAYDKEFKSFFFRQKIGRQK